MVLSLLLLDANDDNDAAPAATVGPAATDANDGGDDDVNHDAIFLLLYSKSISVQNILVFKSCLQYGHD